MDNQYTLILPTLNEEKNIKEVLDITRSLYPKMQIIVADDGSTDKTQDIVMNYNKQNVILLDRSKEELKGITGSILDAVRLVQTEKIIVMDADLQHPPEKIKDIAKQLKLNDLVIGVRKGIVNKWPLHRKLISWGGEALARIRLSLKPFVCLDMMSGFFGIDTKLFREIISKHENKFEAKGYKVLFETLKYTPKETSFGHINYVFGLRESGDSKIGAKHIYYHLKSIFK